MVRRTAIVTGGTGGLGLETARGLIRAGFDVTIVGRNVSKGNDALVDLRNGAAPDQIISLESADLASLADLRRLAARLNRDGRPLDVLVNNAGAVFKTREITADGLERSMATNHFSMFMLTALLLGRLSSAPAARIVNVASSVYRLAKFDPADLTFARRYSTMRAYAVSKLSNIMFTLELAKRLRSTGITVNALNPGAVRSDFNRYLKAWWARWLTIPAEIAARTPLYLALAPKLEGKTGGYYNAKRELTPLLPHARDEAANAQLWTLSDALTGHPWEHALRETEPA